MAGLLNLQVELFAAAKEIVLGLEFRGFEDVVRFALRLQGELGDSGLGAVQSSAVEPAGQPVAGRPPYQNGRECDDRAPERVHRGHSFQRPPLREKSLAGKFKRSCPRAAGVLPAWRKGRLEACPTGSFRLRSARTSRTSQADGKRILRLPNDSASLAVPGVGA